MPPDSKSPGFARIATWPRVLRHCIQSSKFLGVVCWSVAVAQNALLHRGPLPARGGGRRRAARRVADAAAAPAVAAQAAAPAAAPAASAASAAARRRRAGARARRVLRAERGPAASRAAGWRRRLHLPHVCVGRGRRAADQLGAPHAAAAPAGTRGRDGLVRAGPLRAAARPCARHLRGAARRVGRRRQHPRQPGCVPYDRRPQGRRDPRGAAALGARGARVGRRCRVDGRPAAAPLGRARRLRGPPPRRRARVVRLPRPGARMPPRGPETNARPSSRFGPHPYRLTRFFFAPPLRRT